MHDIIIVGNGQSILSRERGAEIDSHAVVMRLNNYCIRGFEKWVGTKRTIHFRRFNIRPARPILEHVITDGLQDDHHDMFERAVILPMNRREHEPKCPELARYAKWDVIPWDDAKALRQTLGGKLWPSTGAYAIDWAARTYGSVQIVGFDVLTRARQPSEFGHWYTGSRTHPTIQGRYHDFLGEATWLAALIDAGTVSVMP